MKRLLFCRDSVDVLRLFADVVGLRREVGAGSVWSVVSGCAY